MESKPAKDVLLVINTIYFAFSSNVNLHFNHYYLQNKLTEEQINTLIPDKNVWYHLGNVFKETLIDRVYFTKTKPFTSLEDIHNETSNGVLDVEMVFNFLWFIKDNSCNASSLGIYCPDSYYSIVHSSFLYSNAKGDFTETSFSIEEINEAFRIMLKFFSIRDSQVKNNKRSSKKDKSTTKLYTEDQSKMAIIKGGAFDVEYNEYNRIDRAINFLKQARRAPLLPEKIAFYVLILECLFSPKEKTEIQYKLSDRVSLYAADGNIERHYIYELVKDSYNLRSRYVHGDELNKEYKTIENLKLLSVKLDNLIRKILKKVILEDSDLFVKSSDDLTKWLNELKFGIY